MHAIQTTEGEKLSKETSGDLKLSFTPDLGYDSGPVTELDQCKWYRSGMVLLCMCQARVSFGSIG